MQVITENELLARIETFLVRHGMARTTFGRKATGNANLLKELEQGKSPSLRTAQRIAAFITAQDRANPNSGAPLELTSTATEEELALPFAIAPAGAASSPTCSSTTVPSTSSAASASCPACSPAATAAPLPAPAPSCSATDREAAK